jgi:hypothetical protein
MSTDNKYAEKKGMWATKSRNFIAKMVYVGGVVVDNKWKFI